MDSASQKLTWLISTEKQQNMDPASWKLTGKEKLSPTTHQMDACSCKLTGEENSESTIQMNVCPLRLIGELMKPIKMDTTSLKLIGEVMIQVFSLWMDAYSLKLIGEPMIQVPSFTLCTLIMMQSQRISSPKDCGEDYRKGHLPPLSWSTSRILVILDKLKMDFATPIHQSRDIEFHTLFLTLNTMKVLQSRNLCNLHSSGSKAQVSSLPKQRE